LYASDSRLEAFGLLRHAGHRGRSSAPLKLNLWLTYWCQYGCRPCNIWQCKPSDELTTEKVVTLVRENANVNCVALSGGENFLRPAHASSGVHCGESESYWRDFVEVGRELLDSCEKILTFFRTTKTQTGQTVSAFNARRELTRVCS